MRLLFVTSGHPAPRVKGYQVRAYQQIRLMSAEHAVSLLCFGRNRDRDSALEEMCETVEVIPEPRMERWFRMLGALATREPLQMAYYRSRAMARAIRRTIRSGRFDAVIVQMSRMGGYIELFPADAVAVLDLVDSMGFSMAQRAESSAPPMRWLWRWEGWKARRYERSLIRGYDATLVVSASDRDHLAEPEVRVNPIGVDVDRFGYTIDSREDAQLLFVGNMQYYANVDAATYLAEEILPLVQRNIPSATLVIVGAAPTPEVRALGERSGVTVTGFVPDVVPYLRAATVGVFPMRVGSGMQNKVLEAMATGLPVVTTSKVLAGVRATPGEHLLTGAGAPDLAARATELLRRPALRNEIAGRGRALVEREYTWQRSVQGLIETIGEATERRAGRDPQKSRK